MNGPPTEIESRQLEELIQTVDDLRRRVAALERQSLLEPADSVPPLEIVGSPARLSTGLLASLGRVLLGIAGAYLLRAITEAALLPQLAGTLAALLYAGAWLASAAGIRSTNGLNAATHAITAALIAVPLLWEATVRFHSLSPESAATALALFIVLGQIVAWRTGLPVIAGIASFAGSATALALTLATLNPIPFTIALLIAAAAIESLACRDQALAQRWVIALAVDSCAFLLLYLITRPQGVPEGYAAIPVSWVIGVEIALAAIYVVSTVIRTLRRGLSIAAFEIAQLVLAMTLAIGCGVRVAHEAGVFGAGCLAAGVLAYLAAFASRSLPGRNFHAYAAFAVLLVLSGGTLALPPLARTVLWSVLSLAGTAIGARTRRNTLRVHGSIYLVAASFSSGLLGYSTERMLDAGWPPLTMASMLCAAAIVVTWGLALRLRDDQVLWNERVSAVILAALLSWNMAGLAAGVLIGAHTDVSLAGPLRTALIAAIALICAWFGPRRDLQELIWILYPWMVFGALKLFLEDFRQGRPATLFLSLLLYGGTLLAIPRLLRPPRSSRADPP